MTQEHCAQFASSAGWAEQALTNPAVVEAIVELASDNRPAESILCAPTLLTGR